MACKIVRFSVTTGLATCVAVLLATPAQAAPCSLENPATLAVVTRRNFDGERIQVTHGEQPGDVPIVEYSVTGCEPGGGLVTADVHGIANPRAITADIVSKGTAHVSLQIHVNAELIAPGDYDVSIVSTSPALPLLAAVGVDVKDGNPAAPWMTYAVGCVLGLLVLAVRAAVAAGSTVKFFFKFFSGIGWLLPTGAGVAGAFVPLRAQFIESPTWFATDKQLVALGVSALSAMIAAGTTATALTTAGARTK